MKYTILTLLALSASLTAQTAIPLAQMKTVPAPLWRIIAVAPDGSYKQLELDAGFVILNNKITVAAPAAVPKSQRLTAATDGTFTLPAWTATITRNGLLMEEGEDYTLTAGVLTPINGAWNADDKVVARGS